MTVVQTCALPISAKRTVRATPPPAPTRDAIKSGKFDAVVFTSSSTVRNLVGIAGKPHASTIIAVIGPATAKTAEEHGLRVDVMAAKPAVEELVYALADFGPTPRASARKSVVWGTSASGRVDLGGLRSIQKKRTSRCQQRAQRKKHN